MSDFHNAECAQCHRQQDVRGMVRVSAPDVIEEDFCDWDCFKNFYERELA